MMIHLAVDDEMSPAEVVEFAISNFLIIFRVSSSRKFTRQYSVACNPVLVQAASLPCRFPCFALIVREGSVHLCLVQAGIAGDDGC